MEAWGMDREPHEVFDGAEPPRCHVHDHPLKKTSTKYGPFWKCEFAGCTVGWWGRARTTPGTDRARGYRKLLADMVCHSAEPLQDAMTEWMEQKEYTLGTLDEKTGLEACEHMRELRDIDARDRMVRSLVQAYGEAPEAVRAQVTIWLREHSIPELSTIALSQARSLERFLQEALERHNRAIIQEQQRLERERQREEAARRFGSGQGGRKGKKKKDPLPPVEQVKTKRRINLE